METFGNLPLPREVRGDDREGVWVPAVCSRVHVHYAQMFSTFTITFCLLSTALYKK